jgi:hypothetical protein
MTTAVDDMNASASSGTSRKDQNFTSQQENIYSKIRTPPTTVNFHPNHENRSEQTAFQTPKKDNVEGAD